MIKRIRFAIALFFVCSVGALYYAVPFFAKELNGPQKYSKLSLDVSYESRPSGQDFADDNLTQNNAVARGVWVSDYQEVEQGSFFLERQGFNGYQLAPTLETKVDITVTGLIARAKVTQYFTNTSDEWVNGIYVFPLPETAAIDHLEMHIGDRRIEGQIHPKQKAKAIYEQAKRDGKKASLLTQHRTNLFKNAVANIGPGEQIAVTIEYQQAVPFDNGQFSLRFPTTITPRYLPMSNIESPDVAKSGWAMTQSTYLPSALSNDNEPVGPMNKVSISVALDSGFAIENIKSEHHPINITPQKSNGVRVNLKQDMIANRDFVLHWQPKPSNAPKAAHFTQQTEQGLYGMVMLIPPQANQNVQSLPREVIFVIDTSGSMSGESMQQAKFALSSAIDNLTINDTFNLIDFDSTANMLWPQSRPVQQINKGEALEYVANLVADGGTEIMSALQLALGRQQKKSNSEYVRQVIFITDGSVGNEQQLFEYIHQNIQQSRLFTVGIGSAPNSLFMSEAARMGKGTFTYISSVENVQANMQNLFDKLQNPVLTDLLVNFSHDVSFYPQQLPDLYQGEPILISYHTETPVNTLQVSGQLRNQYWDQSLSLTQSGEQSGLDVLWARRKIAQLGRNKLMGHNVDEVNQAIEDVAMQHHLVSEMTSLVAVDVTPTALAVSQDKQVGNHLPKGLTPSQSIGSLPQTATPSHLMFLLGLISMSIGLCLTIFTKSR